MPDRIGTRYVPSTQIVSFPHGTLHYGDDVFLTRKVLLYRKALRHNQLGVDYISSLQDKAAFIHDGFHHMLDTSIAQDAVTIILQAKSGSLFAHTMFKRKWTYAAVVAIISDLGVSLLDAMEDKITGFSVRPDNLWLTDQNKLSVINYWEVDEPQEQGAVGLCRLMIQLLTGSETISDTFEVMHTSLERASIPSATTEQKLALIRLIKFICHGQSSLSSLVFGLRSLPPTVPSNKSNMEAEPIPEGSTEVLPVAQYESHTRSNRSAKLIALGAVSALVVGVVSVWYLWPEPRVVETVVIISPTPTSTPIATASPSATATAKLTTLKEEGESTVVPNLVGQTQEAAEQMALAAGLHYNFFIETSTLAKGTVTKQDPKAGTNGLVGDNVTFWVSKGAQ
ncbi:Stk1 family PASTA domain-containing Ser/Thr kinase [Paenibacillus qinlingensis]|uniref:Stk1 family PASTA domain-containing Ser/Thr kinase n=1 Tax=Paenibacillus qinlingensis TaxID=1837343 RepID=UPI001566E236|nr:Stk1 family PASTA domain-containing Ser/Thr kinase [Paenibacillus qinlingensis]NQX57833.1 PASTA domain-containing protein [Paenibacillus qinlingensis]